MRDGAIVAEFQRDTVSEERLIEASFREVSDGPEGSHAQQAAERARRREAFVSGHDPACDIRRGIRDLHLTQFPDLFCFWVDPCLLRRFRPVVRGDKPALHHSGG